MLNLRTQVALSLFTLMLGFSSLGQAGEFQIGDVKKLHGLDIAAVYLQAVKMSPSMPEMGDTDIHLEADIHANKNNINGFTDGDWIPYLSIAYHLKKQDSNWTQTGSLQAMVASDGPHYGENIKLDGPGKYNLSYRIYPPVRLGFTRHVDKETKVADWWQNINLDWEFVYLGTGKKGGY